MNKNRQNEKEEILVNVQPIRTKEKIEDMKWSLKTWCGERDYILFLLGINSGLRCGDMLKLKISDIKGKKHFFIKENKTTKTRKIHLENIYDELNDYIKTIENKTIWLFPSRQGSKPVSRTQIYRQLNKAAAMVDIEAVGTHTMRKTFGYWYYKATLDVAALQQMLNHSKQEVTLRYIGIAQEELDNSMKNFKL